MDRGQAHTLEATVAALLLLVSVGIALQMTAVTPLSASTSSQHLENQLEHIAEGILASNAESGRLKAAILYWNASGSQFYDADTRYYYTDDPPSNLTLGRALNQTLDERNVAYNVYVVFQSSSGDQKRRRMIYRGDPSEHAVSASHSVTLIDDDRLRNADGSVSADTLGSIAANTNTSVYIPDSTPSTNGIYNHVRVEVVAWRI